MAYTQVPTVTSASTLSAAQMNTYIRDNINWFREDKPIAFVFSDDEWETGLSTATDTQLFVGSIAGGSGAVKWGDSSLFDLLPTLAHMELDDTAWYYIGGYAKFEDDNSGSDYKFELKRIDDAVEFGRWRTRGPRNDRKPRMAAGTIITFDATNERFNLEVRQETGGSVEVTGEMWAAWMADSSDYALHGSLSQLKLDAGDTIDDWWDAWSANSRILYHRPSTRIRKGSTQSISDDTWTTVTFDTTASDNTSGDAVGTNLIEALYDGFYYCSAGASLASFTGGSDEMRIQFNVNGSDYGTHARSFDVNSGSGTVHLEQIVYMEAGDELTLEIYKGTTGGSSTLEASNVCHLAASLVSAGPGGTGALGTYYNPGATRQVFWDGIPFDTPDFTAPDSPIFPSGLANICCHDLFLHLWNPPVLGVMHPDDWREDALPSGGWHDLNFSRIRFDSWGFFDNADDDSGGKITLPMDGIYLVVGAVQLAADGVGHKGDRGIRIKHKNQSLATIRSRGAGTGTLGWSKSTSTLIRGRKGDEVRLQALQTATETIASGDERPIEIDGVRGNLSVVWLRER